MMITFSQQKQSATCLSARSLGAIGAIIGSVATCAGCSSAEQDELPATHRIAPDSRSTTDVDAQSDETQILPETDASNSILLELDLGEQRTFTFYESAPGIIMMGESASSDASQRPPVFNQAGSFDPLEIYQYLRPDEPIPQVLLEAWQRAEAAPSGQDAPVEAQDLFAEHGGGSPQLDPEFEPTPNSGDSSDGLRTIRQAHSSSSASHFTHDANCDWDIPHAPVRRFLCRAGWANGYFAQYSDGTASWMIIDHHTGNGVTVRLTQPESSPQTWQVSPGQVRYLSDYCPTWCRWEVLNASGDSFHVRVAYYDA